MVDAGKLALCGKYPCHHICTRVQHCPAGQERVHWYALFDRLSKEESKPRTYLRRTPSGVIDTRTGELLPDPIHIGALNSPERKKSKRVYSPSGEIVFTPYGVKHLSLLKNIVTASLILIMVCAVCVIGFLCNGSRVVPDIKPDQQNLPPYEWQWDK